MSLEPCESRGFGFVTYAHPAKIEEVLAAGPLVLNGNTLDVRLAIPKHMADIVDITLGCRKIFVGGLSKKTDAGLLQAYFSTFGSVQQVLLLNDPNTGRHRGFAFITFEDSEIADRVCIQNPHVIGNRLVECKLALPKAAVKRELEYPPISEPSLESSSRDSPVGSSSSSSSPPPSDHSTPPLSDHSPTPPPPDPPSVPPLLNHCPAPPSLILSTSPPQPTASPPPPPPTLSPFLTQPAAYHSFASAPPILSPIPSVVPTAIPVGNGNDDAYFRYDAGLVGNVGPTGAVFSSFVPAAGTSNSPVVYAAFPAGGFGYEAVSSTTLRPPVPRPSPGLSPPPLTPTQSPLHHPAHGPIYFVASPTMNPSLPVDNAINGAASNGYAHRASPPIIGIGAPPMGDAMISAEEINGAEQEQFLQCDVGNSVVANDISFLYQSFANMSVV